METCLNCGEQYYLKDGGCPYCIDEYMDNASEWFDGLQDDTPYNYYAN